MTAVKWILALGATAGTGFIAYEAVTIPFLRGAGLAQADFELFIFLVVLGIPAGLIVIGVALYSWQQARRLASVPFAHWLAHEPLGLLCAANITVLALAWVFLLYIRAAGLHAIRL